MARRRAASGEGCQVVGTRSPVPYQQNDFQISTVGTGIRYTSSLSTCRASLCEWGRPCWQGSYALAVYQ